MKKLLMLVVGGLLTAGVARAEPVEYRDYDARTGTFTNAVRECTLVTGATRTLENGWYAVAGSVDIPEGTNLTVVGTAHLVLCDGASLAIPNPGEDNAGVKVPENASLVICGQTSGTGELTVTGGKHGAGIGGGYNGSGGMVTINGGTVSATGGEYGAGIGGGDNGAGGTLTIRGGVVTAQGGREAAGIGGGGWGETGGTLTIMGGVVTATGGEYGAGIGGGHECEGGTVTITGGAVIANGNGGGETIGHGAGNVGSGMIRITGGIFGKEPNDEWLYHAKVETNPDPATKSVYPWKVTGFDIPYLDWDPVSKEMTNAFVRALVWSEVTEEMRTMENGRWYVVTNHIDFSEGANLTVNGSAHLILCDGASLTIPNPGGNNAGVKVPEDASLVIYGQTSGTGVLTATGGFGGAGIGGGMGSAGAVTINGGTVTATGGQYGAGIGGGYTGNGTVTINGGTVTATGGLYGAGLGSGLNGPNGMVTISGGAIYASGMQNIVQLSGGVFARPIRSEWIAAGHAIGGNSDSATSTDYPYAVMSAEFTVTIGDHPHSAVQWTYVDGSVTNPVTGASFRLGTGLCGVRVVFTPEYGYRFVDKGETGVRELDSPAMSDYNVEAPEVEVAMCEVTFAVGEGIRRAAYVHESVTNELVTAETTLALRLGARVELLVEEEPLHYPFAGERTFTAEQETMRVEIFARPIPKGMEGNPFQVGADVFAVTNAEGVLTITGTGAMSNFVSAADVPWVSATVTEVTVAAGVERLGANAFAALDDAVTVNGTALSMFRFIVPALGSAQPAGAIGGAEFESIDIIDGKAYLGVSVYTSDTLTNQNWSVATNGVIEVPAEGKQGFFILKSKPAK